MTESSTPDFADSCWPVDTSCCDGWDTYDPTVQQRAIALATSTLRALSAYQVGGCPITVRPCRQNCWQPFLPYAYPGQGGGMWGGWWWGWTSGWGGPVNISGRWVNMGCGCFGECGCTVTCEVLLPPPVGYIDKVTIDGTVLPESWYRVDNYRRLVWEGDPNQPDMKCGWPLCQDMNEPAGAENTFTVSYLNAHPVDGQASYAAGILACEFAKASCGKTCRLPPGVTAVTRQGVAYQVNPGTFPGGVTGVPEIDAWLRLVNPKHLAYPPSVWWPGMNQGRLTTWQAGMTP